MKKRFSVLAMACMLAAMGLVAQAKAKQELTGQVNVNEASVEELTMLPGIGVARAKEIQTYAQAHPFQSVDELKEVKGIGDKSLETLRPFVTVSGPTTAKWAEASPGAVE